MMDKGKIAETGTHDRSMALKGLSLLSLPTTSCLSLK
jgi:hypothetical protein